MADHEYAPLQNDDHENRPLNPSGIVRRLSIGDSEAGGHYAKGKRASTMSQAFGMAILDSDVSKVFRPTLVVGQLFFQGPVEVSTLREVLHQRLVAIPRFRCSVKLGADSTTLLTSLPATSMDMEYHVHALPELDGKPWSRQAVDRLVSRIYRGGESGNGDEDEEDGSWSGCCLDYSHPPWRFFVIRMEDGRTLVLPVIDHVLVDGVAAVAALMSILDDDSERAPESQAPRAKRTAGPPMSLTGRIHALLCGLKEALLSPVLPADPLTVLKEKDHRHPAKSKCCATGEKVSLEEMKRIKGKFPGATVNDIMLATLTLTIQGYFSETCQVFEEVRGNFPINMRPPAEDVIKNSMGNRFAAGNFVFPLRMTDPVKMIWSIKAQIDTIKRSPGPLIVSKLFDVLIPNMITAGAKMKKILVNMILDTYGKVTVMLSNVPGPSEQVTLCGQPVDDLMFYALAPLGCYLGVISYNGAVSLGVTTSRAVESNPERLAKHWGPAFKKLKDAVDAAPPSEFDPPRRWGDAVLVLGLGGLAAAFFLRRRPA